MGLIEVNHDVSAKQLAWFGALLALFAAALALVVWLRFDAPNIATGIAASGVALTATYYALPRARRPIYLGWMYAFFPIGWTMTHLLLTAVFFLVVTPIGIVMRVCGYDPLNRTLDRGGCTYWIECDEADDPKRYFRQF